MLQFKIGASISDNGTDKIHTGKWNVKSRHEKMGKIQKIQKENRILLIFTMVIMPHGLICRHT